MKGRRKRESDRIDGVLPGIQSYIRKKLRPPAGEGESHGFILVVFPYGDSPTDVHFVNDNASVDSAVCLLREVAARIGGSYVEEPGHA